MIAKSNFFKNNLGRAVIVLTFIVIIAIYYFSEIRPFPYENYEKQISQLQRYDAELNEALTQARFGLLNNYNPISDALSHSFNIVQQLKKDLRRFPNTTIDKRLNQFIKTLQHKKELTNKFQQINPQLTHSVFQFSTFLAEIIESEAHVALVEGCLQQTYHYQLMDKVNNLFREILLYTTQRQEAIRTDLSNLIEEISVAPEKPKKLDESLNFAKNILTLQPKLLTIDKAIFALPIIDNLTLLNESFASSYSGYLARGTLFRSGLYILAILLVACLQWAFSRLYKTISALHQEVDKKIQAEQALAKINHQLEERVNDRTKELTQKNNILNKIVTELKSAQTELITQEKMASIGRLSTGIAHEIKNPLNFVNNFSEISVEIVAELKEIIQSNFARLDSTSSASVKNLIDDLELNCNKIKEHGERADNIVKNLLSQTEETSTQKELTDLNSLTETNLNLALESFSSTHDNFKPTIHFEKDSTLQKIIIAPQGIGRALIYLLDNAFYALWEKLQTKEYAATLTITTSQEGGLTTIKIHDNGTGISQNVLDKIFEPFFTTKPPGKGNTGLGLSICYDIVVKQHKGELKVSAKEGEFTEFTIILPNQPIG